MRKLSPDDVLTIWRLRRKLFTHRLRAQLAKVFSVSTSTIYDVVAGRTWRHVTHATKQLDGQLDLFAR